MLKLLKSSNLFATSSTKCGEIFYHNSKDFTIYCTICQMKSFHFDDFLQHVRNVHLENHIHQAAATQTNELNEYLQITATNEAELCEIENCMENNNLQVNLGNEAELCETDDILENCMEIDYLQESHENEAVLCETGDTLDNCIEQPSDIGEFDVESCSEEEKLMIIKKPRKEGKFKRRIRCNSENQDVNNEASADDFEIQFKPSHNKNEKAKSEKANKPLFSCPECQQIFDLKKYMDNHVIEIHKGYKCSFCDTRFLYRNHLQRHELKHNPEYKFPCTIAECTKIYNDPDNLKRHLLTHNPEQNFPCPIAECNQIYRSLRNLEKHLIVHKNTNRNFNRFICDICGYSCRAEATLTIHRRSHTGERPFLCEVCKKGFVSKGALNMHMEKHSNIRRYSCKICHSSFSRSEILEKHMFLHSDGKRFKCKICDKAFKQPQGLYCHIRRLHTEPKTTTDKNNKEI